MLIKPTVTFACKTIWGWCGKQAKFGLFHSAVLTTSFAYFLSHPLKIQIYVWGFMGSVIISIPLWKCIRSPLEGENGNVSRQVLINTWIHEYMSGSRSEQMCCWVERFGLELFTFKRPVVESCSFMVSVENCVSRRGVSLCGCHYTPLLLPNLCLYVHILWNKDGNLLIEAKSNQYDNLCIFHSPASTAAVHCVYVPRKSNSF